MSSWLLWAVAVIRKRKAKDRNQPQEPFVFANQAAADRRRIEMQNWG